MEASGSFETASPAVRWARAGMGAYWLVSGIASLAASPTDVGEVMLGSPNSFQVLLLAAILFQVLSAILFAVGLGSRVIAGAWIAFAIGRAALVHGFWSAPPEAVGTVATAFSADLAVIASLMLYLARQERRSV